MHLRSLELTGFKSFAKRTALSFTTPITAIVGPNGSGKSNVSEAFRFVLGEQSVKSMRGKRTEDLIWNGAEGAPRGNRGAVKLVFDNTPQGARGMRLFSSIDFDEVSVERVVYRDASTEYFVNGSPARLRNIHELLVPANLSHGGYHIISQGEADRILSESARERRALIEDALGLKIYEWKRAESEKKLEKTRENMRQVESLRRELAPHLSFLKKQAEKVEKAKAQKETFRALAQEYFAREEAYLAEAHAALAEVSRAPARERAEVEQKLLRLQGASAPARDEVGTLSRELGRLEGEAAAIDRALRERKGATARRHIVLSEVEELVAEIEHETLLERVKALLRAFVERYRSAPAPADAALERRAGEVAHARRALEEKIQQAEAAASAARDAGEERLRLLARKAELDSEIRDTLVRREDLERREADYRRELGEAALLVGRGAIMPTGTPFASEPREKQEERGRALLRLKVRLEDSGAAGAEEVLCEYRDTSERDAFLARELDDLEASAASLLTLIKELGETLNREFETGLARINVEFQKLFALMFGGGTARLRAVSPAHRSARADTDTEEDEGETESFARAQDAEEEDEARGVEVEVSIPRKKIKGLAMLSGGERALTSIALIFALSAVKPPPFIILDETDAALDEANSRTYGDMVERLAEHSQLILITHNRETMSRAGVLYGVTMERGASRLLSIAFDAAAKVAK